MPFVADLDEEVTAAKVVILEEAAFQEVVASPEEEESYTEVGTTLSFPLEKKIQTTSSLHYARFTTPD